MPLVRAPLFVSASHFRPAPPAAVGRRGGAVVVCVAALVAGCATDGGKPAYVPHIVTPYRIDVQQGNFITQEMVDKLAVGQTREQVRFILGTPLLTDIFHANRWDYLYRHSKGWNAPERRKLVVHFDADGRLARWEAEVPPPAPATPPPAPPAQAPAAATPREAPASPPGAVSGAGNLVLGEPGGARGPVPPGAPQ
ncbi:MAG: outer membrane protein assembly factor BamE [Burkholderiales bacterium]|nr:outer membrane protein assembly factor BamE [Burkholderiales bacterium]